MQFNFHNDDDDDENPFKDISKIFHELQRQLFNQMKEGNLDLSDSNIKRFGFSLHMGPNGKPHIAPLNNQNNPFPHEMSGTTSKNGFEEPFTDVFYNKENQTYQIIAEMPGISEEHVHFKIDGNDFSIHAENGDRKYKKSMLLKFDIKEDEIKYAVRNGVLEVKLKTDQ